MNGQYIYKPPPPPPPPSSGSGSTARSGAGSGSSRGGRGGGSRRGAGNSNSTRGGARSRAQPYQVSGSSYRQRVAAAAAAVVPPSSSSSSSALPSSGLLNSKDNHDNNDEEVDDEEELGKTGTQDQNAARSIIVPGTSISLNTAQEIEEWIKERRKKWPTTARVEAKLREQPATASAKAGSSTDNTRPKGVCKFFARSGRCNNGAQCRFEHSRPVASDSPRNNNNNNKSGKSSKTEYKLYEAHKKMPLFKMLVRNDMDKENGVVLDFIAFLCKNDLL